MARADVNRDLLFGLLAYKTGWLTNRQWSSHSVTGCATKTNRWPPI